MKQWQSDKQKLLLRLRRIEGQVRGVAGMVDEEQDCEAVVQQFAAVRQAMDKAFFDLMACVTRRELESAGIKSGSAIESRLAQVTQLLAKYA